MMIRHILGIILIAIPIFPIYASISHFSDTNGQYETARDTVLLCSNDLMVGETASFKVTYPHTHGVWVVNAIIANGEESAGADLSVHHSVEEEPLLLNYIEGEKSLISYYNKQLEVTKLQNSKGSIQFKNVVCGCEMTGPGILMAIVLFLGALFIGTGLFVILKKRPSRS